MPLYITGEIRLLSWKWCQSGRKIHPGQSEPNQKVKGASTAAGPSAAGLWRTKRLHSHFLHLYSSILPILTGARGSWTHGRRRGRWSAGVRGASWSGPTCQAAKYFQWGNPKSARYSVLLSDISHVPVADQNVSIWNNYNGEILNENLKYMNMIWTSTFCVVWIFIVSYFLNVFDYSEGESIGSASCESYASGQSHAYSLQGDSYTHSQTSLPTVASVGVFLYITDKIIVFWT